MLSPTLDVPWKPWKCRCRGRICQDTTRRPANPCALSPTVTGCQSSRDLTLENSNFDEEDYDSSTNLDGVPLNVQVSKPRFLSQNGTFSPPHTSPSQSPCWLPWRCEIPATRQTRVGQAMCFFHRETIPLNMVNLIYLSKKTDFVAGLYILPLIAKKSSTKVSNPGWASFMPQHFQWMNYDLIYPDPCAFVQGNKKNIVYLMIIPANFMIIIPMADHPLSCQCAGRLLYQWCTNGNKHSIKMSSIVLNLTHVDPDVQRS